MARRQLVIVLALAAVIVLLAAAAAAQSDAKGPKEDKPKGPSERPPKAQGPKEKEPKEEKEKEPKGPKDPKGPKEKEPKVPKVKEPKGPKEKEPKVPKVKEPKVPKVKPMEVICKTLLKENPYCYFRKFECPNSCPQSCYVDCYTCKPVCVCNTPGACGDPRFIGGDGNAFYFHGRTDADFCVISDRDLHINAHFIGKSGHSGMSRNFTWIQAIGVLFDGHRLYVGAQKTDTWDDAVEHLDITLDGEPVHLPTDRQVADAKWTSSRVPGLSITRTKAANGVLVVLDGKFTVRANAVPITEEDSRLHRYGVTSDDCLAHLELAFKFDALTDDVHGVVGQTYRSDYVNKFDVRASMPTMRGDASFNTSSLFAADCAVARFGTSSGNAGASVMSELAGVTCASGMDGKGVVCKK